MDTTDEQTVAPKGPVTAYAFFVQHRRTEHERDHPHEKVNFSEFIQNCSRDWAVMSPEEKEPFQDKAVEDKERYKIELANSSENDVIVEDMDRHWNEYITADPRPLTAFCLFYREHRSAVTSKHPNYSSGQVAKELGRRWISSEPAIKAKYQALANKSKSEYDAKCKEIARKSHSGNSRGSSDSEYFSET